MTYRFDNALGLNMLTGGMTFQTVTCRELLVFGAGEPEFQCVKTGRGEPPTRYAPGKYSKMSWCDIAALPICGSDADRKSVAARETAALKQQAADASARLAQVQAFRAKEAADMAAATNASKQAYARAQQEIANATKAAATAAKKQQEADAAAAHAAEVEAAAAAATGTAANTEKRAKRIMTIAAVGGGAALLVAGFMLLKKH